MPVTQDGWKCRRLDALGIQKRRFGLGMRQSLTFKAHGLEGGLQDFSQISQQFGLSLRVLTFCGYLNSFPKRLFEAPVIKYGLCQLNCCLSGHVFFY
jgi:hypothetical protein